MAVEVEATLRSLRKVGHKPLVRIAEECGVTTKTVLQWENGAAPPTIEHAVDHAKALGISLDDYWGLWQHANAAWQARRATGAAS